MLLNCPGGTPVSVTVKALPKTDVDDELPRAGGVVEDEELAVERRAEGRVRRHQIGRRLHLGDEGVAEVDRRRRAGGVRDRLVDPDRRSSRTPAAA